MIKVLMAVDGSAHDTRTAQLLGTLFRGNPDVEITVVSVANTQLPTPPLLEMGMVPVMPSPHEMERWEREVRSHAQEVVTQAEAEVQRLGLRTKAQVAWGSPADAIVQLAEQGGFDLIAVGSRGAGQVAGIFLGSVSDRVAHRAKTPVLIVR